MNFTKKLAAVALLATSLLITGCGEGQIGTVDVNKIMEEAPRVKTLMEEAQGKVTAEQQKFEQENADKELSEEEALKVQMDFQRKLESINQAYAAQTLASSRCGGTAKIKSPVRAIVMFDSPLIFISPSPDNSPSTSSAISLKNFSILSPAHCIFLITS